MVRRDLQFGHAILPLKRHRPTVSQVDDPANLEVKVRELNGCVRPLRLVIDDKQRVPTVFIHIQADSVGMKINASIRREVDQFRAGGLQIVGINCPIGGFTSQGRSPATVIPAAR